MSFITGLTSNLTQGLASSLIPSGSSIDTADHTLWLFGDSISSQNTGNAQRFEGYGYATCYQAMSGQRFAFSHDTNKGVSGDDASEALARITDLASVAAGDIVIVLLGANDFGTSSGAGTRDPADVQSNVADIIDYITNTKSATAVLCTTTPCDDNTSTQISNRETYNAWVATQAASNVIIVDVWDAVSDGSGDWVSGYSHDGVHPNMRGAWVIGRAIYDALAPIYGTRNFTLSDDNVLTNTDFSGTGGTITSLFTGTLADDWICTGSGLGYQLELAKDTDNKQLANFDTNNVATMARRIYQQYVDATLPTKQGYFEIEISFTEDMAGTGGWYAMSAELRNHNSEMSIGYDRQTGASSPISVPTDIIRQFQADTGRNLLFRSPTYTFPAGSTAAIGRINIEFVNTSGQSVSGGIKLHNSQLVVTA